MWVKKMRLNKTDWAVFFCLFIMMPVIVFVFEKLKYFFNFNDTVCAVVATVLIYAAYAVGMIRSTMEQYQKIITKNKTTENCINNKEEIYTDSEQDTKGESN